MRTLVCLLAVGLLPVLLAAPVRAQTTVDVGPRVGLPVGDLADDGVLGASGASVFVGADVRVTSAGLPVVFGPSFDLYLIDSPGEIDRSAFTVDLNLLYEIGDESYAFTPYVGGGPGITRISLERGSNEGASTEVGINLVGGARLLLGVVQPFAQFNLTVGGDLKRRGITGGVLFRVN